MFRVILRLIRTDILGTIEKAYMVGKIENIFLPAFKAGFIF